VPHSAPHNISTQERLIKDLQNGGPNASIAMKKLYENYRYKNYISQYSSEFNIPATQVQDFLQDAFLTFVKKAKKSDFNIPKDINVYITSIAKNLIQNYARKLKTEEIVAEDKAIYGVSEPHSTTLHLDESKNALKDIMAKIDPQCRRLLRLWANGFSYIEIAEKLSLSSHNRARQKKHRCIKKIVEILPLFPQLKDFRYE
jgi:RNA polymerase sigma factor (sigma-70 family)